MNQHIHGQVVILGAGPAGLAAARSACEAGASVILIEREHRLGGILKQCIHDGFGLFRFAQRLTGPEYANRERTALQQVIHNVSTGNATANSLGKTGEIPGLSTGYPQHGLTILTKTFLTSVVQQDRRTYLLTCVNQEGMLTITAQALILATGCRERTDRQIFIHGDRPAGIFTAGLAQYMVNIQGVLPGSKAVILGSGDIGLIMARRLHLEGVQVLGVYEIQNEPSGLARNLRQCLEDFAIPLHLNTTVTRVHGADRVQGLTLVRVDDQQKPIPGTQFEVECDTLILSVGLIPENEVARSLGVPLDRVTRGPIVDQSYHTLVNGIFACGNALHVSDLADYVSESGDIAGREAARWAMSESLPERNLVPLEGSREFLYVVPQRVNTNLDVKPILHFRVRRSVDQKSRITLSAEVSANPGAIKDSPLAAAIRKKPFSSAPVEQPRHSSSSLSPVPIAQKTCPVLRPAEMERMQVSQTVPSHAQVLHLTCKEVP